MIIKPMVRSNTCFTAHPEGCKVHVNEQIEYVKGKEKINGPKNVLVIGASTGYGLASRIVSAYNCNAKTVGVFFERPAADKRTASAGLYNSAAFEENANQNEVRHFSINGDAFSDEIKEKTIEVIKEKLDGKIDLVVYSIASPKRTHPKTGETYASTLKPIGSRYDTKTVNFLTGKLSTISIEPATEEEIEKTVIVMGGEDWQMWIDALAKADVLADGVKSLAYSYIGPKMTYPVYREGTIGRAKEHLEATAKNIDAQLKKALNGEAYVSVNKALVTQASSAIPAVPLYISLLYKKMKENNTHEDCIHQIYRLFHDFLYSGNLKLDDKGRIRLDDLEMMPEVQKDVQELWDKVDEDNIFEISDLKGYQDDFYRLFGFGFDGIDYSKDIDPEVEINLL